jgi:hypothetical protein
MRQHVSESLEEMSAYTNVTLCAEGPMSNRDEHNYTGPSGYLSWRESS